MTKKIFAMFLAVLMVVSLLPTSVFAADATCPGKGKDHTLSNCEHTAVKVTEPTCGAQGYTTYVCNKCGDTFVADFVAATGEHNWEVKDIAPTCTEPGYIGAKVCADCGKTEGGEKVDALGKIDEDGNTLYAHVFGNWSTLADCTKGGTITRTCELCGHVEEKKIDKVAAHVFGEWKLTTPATAEANGEATHKCNNCDTTETIVVYYDHDHNESTMRWVEQVNETCTAAGVKGHWVCRVCGQMFVKTENVYTITTAYGVQIGALAENKTYGYLPAAGDDNGLWTITAVDGGYTIQDCYGRYLYMTGTYNSFNVSATRKTGDVWTLTENSDGTCTIKNVAKDKVMAYAWEYKTVGAYAADNAAKNLHDTAFKLSQYVSVKAEDLVIKSGHDELAEKLNCKVINTVCIDCGNVVQLPKIEHKFENWTIPDDADATCVADGYKISVCSVCGIAKDLQTIPAKGHLTATVTVPATCGQYGYTYTYCMRSDCSVGTKVASKVVDGVTYDLSGNSVLSTPVDGATIYLVNTHEGTMYYLNSVSALGCDLYTAEEIEEYYEEALAITLEAVEGGWLLKLVGEYVTQYICINNRNQPHTNCYSADEATVWTWNAELSTFVALGSDGKTQYCFSADYSGWATASLVKVTDKNVDPLIASIANNDGVYLLDFKVDKDAGYDANNHVWISAGRTEATCLTTGMEVFYCANNCGTNNKTVVLEKAEHTWVNDEGADAYKAPTCTENGYQKQHCSVEGCTATRTNVLDAKGHTLATGFDTSKGEYVYNPKNNAKKFTHAATCTDTLGYDFYYCQICGEVNKTNYTGWTSVGKIWKKGDTGVKFTDKEHVTIAGHGTLTYTGEVAGTCSKVGYYTYKCANCSETVRVQSYWTNEAGKEFLTGSHNWDCGDAAATCETAGKWYNLKCESCGKLRDETLEEGKLVEIPALGHTVSTSNSHYVLDHSSANEHNPEYYCAVCKKVLFDGTKINTNIDWTKVNCTSANYQLYLCACGEYHIRSWVGNFGHNYVKKSDKDLASDTEHKNQAAACTAAGWTWLYCTECGHWEKDPIAQLKHKNAAGVEFTLDCSNHDLDDVYCVLCKVDYAKNSEGKVDRDVNFGHNWSELKYVDAICGDLPYTYRVCSVCYETDKAVEYDKTEWGNDVVFTLGGHTPINGQSGSLRIDRVYQNVYCIKYEWNENNELYGSGHNIYGEFIAYTAPTYTSKGYAKFVCADCGETVEMELDALSGLSFDLDIVNGTDNSDNFYYGSLVEVTVSAESFNTGLYNFKSSLIYNSASFQYVGYEALNNNFDFRVTNPGKEGVADGEITITGAAAGEKKDVVISEKTPMIKLYFRVSIDERWINWLVEEEEYKLSEAKTEYAEAVEWLLANSTSAIFRFVPGEVYNAENKAVNVDTASKNLSETIGVSAFMDVDDNGYFGLNDLGLGIDLITEGKYSVALDINQDGELTLEDVNLAYNYLAGNYTYKEILKMCLSEAETNILFPEAK